MLMFSQANFKGFDTTYKCRHNQSSFHFFLTSADKTTSYNQNSLTSGYRQNKKLKLATCSLVFTVIKPGTFTSISLPTSPLLENHPAQSRHSRMQPCSQTVIYTSNTSFWLQFLKLFSFGPSLFSQVPQISIRMNKLQPSRNVS